MKALIYRTSTMRDNAIPEQLEINSLGALIAYAKIMQMELIIDVVKPGTEEYKQGIDFTIEICDDYRE